MHDFGRVCRELAENLPRSCAACGRLPSIAKLLWPRTVGPRSSEGGWGGGGPPRGVSIRRPPKVCQQRARLISNWLCRITAGQSRYSFAQFDLKCSFPYPFLSPGAWGSPEPSYKFALSVSCWPILVDFFAFPTRGPNPSKIDAKNVLFFNIHFFGFRPRFGRVLGLQVEAKFAILAPQKFFTWTC